MKNEEKIKLKEQLIQIYKEFIENRDNPEVRQKAQKLFFDYIYNNSITDREFLIAIHGLEHIGWEFSRGLQNPSQNWKMREEEAKEILAKLTA